MKTLLLKKEEVNRLICMKDSPGDRRDVARVWLTAPCRPIRYRFSRYRTTWPGVPSFFSAYEVSCRVRAERVKPYAPKSDSPRGPCDPIWVPRPPAPPGGSASRLCCCYIYCIRLWRVAVNAHDQESIHPTA